MQYATSKTPCTVSESTGSLDIVETSRLYVSICVADICFFVVVVVVAYACLFLLSWIIYISLYIYHIYPMYTRCPYYDDVNK